MLFPVPRTGSERWRAYLQQRREYGDAQTACPDTMCEAERLFEIPAGSYDTRGPNELGSKRDHYKALQLLQNRDWAQRIALSASEESDMRSLDNALEKLDHALELDPNCVTALHHRAKLFIQARRFSRANMDISRLDGLRRTASAAAVASDLETTIGSLNELLRCGLDSGSRTGEARSHGRHKRRASGSPIRHSQPTPRSRSHKHHRPSEQRHR